MRADTSHTFCPLRSVITDTFMDCLLSTFAENHNPEIPTSGRWQCKNRLKECIAINVFKSDPTTTWLFSILQSERKLKLQGWLRREFNIQHLTNRKH